MRLLYTPEALDERDEAFRWYEDRQPGLGFSFLARLERLIAHVLTFPEAFRAHANGRRHAPVRTFPYTVVYTVEPDAVVIVAVFHASRDPVDRER